MPLCSIALLSLKRHAVEYRTAQSHLIGIFQVVADSHPSRQLSNLYTARAQLTVEIEARGLTLHSGAKRKYDLADILRCHTVNERFNLKHIRADTVHRRNHSAKHMIKP